MANAGAFYKAKVKRWLTERYGFEVGDLEISKWIHPPGRKPFAVKVDQFGCDLLAVRHDRVAFVQVKGGDQALGNGTFPKAQRAIQAFNFPRYVNLWIVAWPTGARHPRIIVVPHRSENNGEEGTKEGGKETRQEGSAEEGARQKGGGKETRRTEAAEGSAQPVPAGDGARPVRGLGRVLRVDRGRPAAQERSGAGREGVHQRRDSGDAQAERDDLQARGRRAGARARR